MLKTGAATYLLALAAPGAAQTPPPAPSTQNAPPPGFIQASRAYGQCVGAGAQKADPSVTPEAAAAAAVAGCKAQRGEMERTFEAWLSSNTQATEAEKTVAREQLRAGLASAEGEIAAKIRQARAGAAKK